MSQVSPVPHIDMDISIDDLFADIQRVIYQSIPSWRNSELKTDTISGGYINTMIRCWRLDKPKEELIVRIWAKRFEGSVLDNRDIEVRSFQALSKRGCFPKLASTFTNGYCYYSYEGSSIYNDLSLLKEYSYLNAVTKGFVMCHTTEIPEIPKRTNYIRMTRECISSSKEENILKIQKTFPIFNIDFLRNELLALEKEIKSLNSPIVLCHLDGHVRNILWNQKDDHVTFIDCEMTKYDCQGLDIAYHFCSFYWDLIIDDMRMLPIPLEKYMKLFVQHYLQHWFEANGKNPDDVHNLDVEIMLTTVKKFMPLVNLFLVSICIDDRNNLEKVDTYKFAVDRFRDYLRMKSQYLEPTIPK